MRIGASPSSIMRASVVLVAIAASATSCVSASLVMNSWVGKSESELLSSWGSPDSRQKLDDGRVIYTWRNVWTSYENIRTCRKNFTISSEGDTRTLVKRVIDDLEGPEEEFSPGIFREQISLMKGTQATDNFVE